MIQWFIQQQHSFATLASVLRQGGVNRPPKVMLEEHHK
jgi:hypothetical protein